MAENVETTTRASTTDIPGSSERNGSSSTSGTSGQRAPEDASSQRDGSSSTPGTSGQRASEDASSQRDGSSSTPGTSGQRAPEDASSQRDGSSSTSGTRKRKGYITWEEYFMGVACLSAQRSKDPNTQVGACIVNKDNRIVGVGYNGMPNRCHDDLLPWNQESDAPNTQDRQGDPGTANRDDGPGIRSDAQKESKKLYVCHAEMNAVVNRISADLRGCRVYVSLFPCNECAKLLIQSGIKKVIYYSNKKEGTPAVKASKRLFEMAGVSYRKYFEGQLKKIMLDFEAVETDMEAPSTSNR